MREKLAASFDALAPEAKELLRAHPLSVKLCEELARVRPERQIEMVHLMVAAGVYTANYAQALVCATEPRLLAKRKAQPRFVIDRRKQKTSSDEISAIAGELQQTSQIQSSDILALSVYCRYTQNILQNARARKYLECKRPEIHGSLNAAMQAFWNSELLQFGL